MSVFKFHRNLVVAVIDVINSCMLEGAYADKVIERTLKSNKTWGARDRSFIAESSYDIIRNFRLLHYCVAESNKMQDLVTAYFILKHIQLPDWDLFQGIQSNTVKLNFEKAKKHFAILHSYPDDLLDLVKSELPDSYEAELIALNQKADLILRTNTLVTTKDTLISLLASREIIGTTIKGHEDAILIKDKFNVFRDPLFSQGYFEIQDASSQKVATFLDLAPGMQVIDACAGAGGKSLHIASLMKNKGKVLCLDTESWKLEELRKRAKRNRVDIIETRPILNNKTIKRLFQRCDRLLLDVPCSGLGVLRRNPDAKWKVDRAYIEKVKLLQKQILMQYSEMLKPGGKLVYATCSILPSENSKQIAYFCTEQAHFQLEEESFISPAESGFDGFYMARLLKS
ncbi:MAG: RsmB/NOP family class I SAM-dependent RNA methyltransferase [Saprospiraceae bacterium]|nr:RsmB/NOP family class I SAM-dependent RNA methyltransferase [Saprospiraceae bacterium]MBK9221180.1 RsmB/NOP family class I SAM-dependent RNA methyltransferase [Saprospiraceae bacterium]